jgi:hypothetical protein
VVANEYSTEGKLEHKFTMHHTKGGGEKEGKYDDQNDAYHTTNDKNPT